MLPFVALGNPDSTQEPSQFFLTRTCCRMLVQMEQWEKVDRASRIALKYSPHLNGADTIRIYRVQSLMGRHMPAEALVVMDEIQHPSLQGIKKLRPQLLEQVNAAQEANKSTTLKKPDAGANP